MSDAPDFGRWLLVALFAMTWIGISARRVHLLPIGRPAVALVGAVALVVVGRFAGHWGLSVDEALRAIEPHTIALLLGMMIVAAALAEAGFFAAATDALARAARRPVALLWVVTIGAGLLLAVLVNDAICLLATPLGPSKGQVDRPRARVIPARGVSVSGPRVTSVEDARSGPRRRLARRAPRTRSSINLSFRGPLVVALVQARGLPTRPFLFAVAMGSNAGSALTLAGNPQNMLVAKLSSLAYRDYLAAAALPAGGALVITAALLHLLFRRDLAVGTSHAPAPASDRDPVLLYVALASLAGVVVANLLGASLALSALAGAAAVLVVARRRAELLLARVDWSILLFFAGLFVVVAALQRTGLPAQWLASLTPPPAEATGVGSLGVLCAVLLLGSQIVSNVPLILLLEPWIRSFPEAPLVWTVTALVSTLAGNLTLLGSVANIIVIERARERLGFFEYLKVGVLVTTASTAFALLSLWLLW